MDREDLKKIEYDLHMTEKENRERIDELIGHEEFFRIADQDDQGRGVSVYSQNTRHDLWLKWNNELWNRLNWMTHLNFYIGLIRRDVCGSEFDPEGIKWTLDDYVYSR